MVVCKFFQQGSCRYGQNCRFEHIYGSKYSYYAPQSQAPVAQAPQGVTDEQLVNQVQSDVQSALKGGQWILSSYAPFKEKPTLPGLSDLSPEEARLFIYEAKANNNVDQAVAYMNNIVNETRNKYEQLMQPSTNMIKVLRSLYNGEVSTSPFSSSAQSTFGNTNNAASSVFRNAAQNISPFGQNANTNVNPASIFGQASQSIFGAASPENSAAKSIFAQANQNAFSSSMSNNVFGPQSPDAAKSIFAQANQSPQNVFATQQQSNPTNLFASASQQFFGPPQSTPADPFNQQSSPFQSAPSNVFQKPDTPSNVFGVPAQNIFEQNTDDSGTYSKMEEMSEADLEAYKIEKFQLGFIPELPPPRELCI